MAANMNLRQIRVAVQECRDQLHGAVNNSRDYPNVGDLKAVMREVCGALDDLVDPLMALEGIWRWRDG